jgi:hypothetical protein
MTLRKLDYMKLLSLIAHNWPAKVLSLALAIVIFIFHHISVLQERYFSRPLVVETAAGLIADDNYTHTIRVTLRGDSGSILPIEEGDIEVYLDLTQNTEPGVYTVPVELRRKGTALQSKTLEASVSPLEVTITLKKEKTNDG